MALPPSAAKALLPERRGDFLGNGWAFPLDASGGSVAMVADQDSIAQAILMILQTNPGERVMLPDFGCALARLVFAPDNSATLHLIETEVTRALRAWEPRIRVTGVTADPEPTHRNRVVVSVDYLIRARNSRHNLVYPFYLEGSA